MAEPWPCEWSMAGVWLVKTGPSLSDQLSFPADEEAKARLIAAAPLLQHACQKAADALSGEIDASRAFEALDRALAACEPIRQGESHG